jgi:hypothetical protein
VRYDGFTGGTYSGRSITPAGDRCINLYPESVASGNPENKFCLLGTPGANLFAEPPGSPVQSIYVEPATKRVFSMGGNHFYEINEDGSWFEYKVTPIAPGPEIPLVAGEHTFASNGLQMMITCDSDPATAYIFDLGIITVNPLKIITSAGFLGAVSVRMIDGYFITRIPNSREFQISALNDGFTWDALDVGFSERSPSNLVGDIDSHGEYWLFNSLGADIFTDTGAALFPFERINSISIEQGLAAQRSLVRLDSTLFWLGENEHGHARVFMAQGYTPVGVSTRAVEWWFNQYAKHGGISDAKAFGYQDEDGHSFYVITFPSVTCEPDATGAMKDGVVNGATWVYDVAEKQWHERQYTTAGKAGMAISVYHGFGFGKHLVGGGDGSGQIYDLSTDVFQDNFKPIKRIRRAPHLVDELAMITYSDLQLSAQVGNIALADPDKYVVMRASNDGGLTWSNEYKKSLGVIGEYLTRLVWRALGAAMRRVFEISTTVNAAVCWVDAFLTISGDSKEDNGTS